MSTIWIRVHGRTETNGRSTEWSNWSRTEHGHTVIKEFKSIMLARFSGHLAQRMTKLVYK